MYKIVLGFIIFLCTVISAYAQATEDISITTYYPSPVGVYNDLSTNRMKIGRNYFAQAVADDNLIIEGSVGIGTINPQAQLDMDNGGIRLGNKTRTTWPEMEIIGADDGFAGQTGNAACAVKGKQCLRVMSYNFIKVDASCPGATHCLHVCSTFYNTGLAGVEQGNDKDNIHSCDALLGEQNTYLHPGVVQCDAFFSAVCG